MLTDAQLKDIYRKDPKIRVIGTRWVLTSKESTKAMKARLVVQGCQEDKSHIRTDAPTGSRDALLLTIAHGAQEG